MKKILQNRTALFGIVGVVAVAVAAVLIVVSVTGSDKKKTDATSITTTTATTTATTTPPATTEPSTIAGSTETAALFRGIPQKLNVLGNLKAPVTMIEFADLQCPFCREFAVGGLPAIVKEYVRTGKVKIVFAGMAFLGPDSEKALRATFAAGLQNRLWNFLDLLYRNQGPENSGWVTDAILGEIGRAVGLDVPKLTSDAQAAEVDNALASTQQQATSAHVNSTPSFFAGRTGQTLNRINVTSLGPDAFRPTLDALLK